VSTSVCNARLRLEALAGVLLLTLGAIWFEATQNRGGGFGGAIAPPKLAWLAYALFAWYILPPMLARDERVQPSLRLLYRLFFWNMVVRGVVELALMYLWRAWHPYLGVLHDMFSIALLLWLQRRVTAARGLDLKLLRHSYVLISMFVLEIGFALYFAAHFATRGGNALYFVPDDERYTYILKSTSIAVICLTLYFPWFLRGWLFVSHDGRD
jgi:hypothetical protein